MSHQIIDVAATGRNIRRLCAERGLTAEDLQKKLYLGSVQCIYKWMEGRSLPSMDSLVMLSAVLGDDITLEDILVLKRT